jgi:hypothetical protein
MQGQPQSRPPAEAIPLAEAVDPQLVEELRKANARLRAEQSAIPLPPPLAVGTPPDVFNAIADAWRQHPAFHAVAAAEAEVEEVEAAIRNDLCEQLVRGELLAWGREGSRLGRRRVIEPHTWRTLSIEDLEQSIVRAAPPSEARLYSVVVVRKAPASALGPELPAAPQSTVAAETRCRKWLAEQMMAGPPNGPKTRYASEARRLFKIGSRAFGRAWDAAVEQSGNNIWRKPGRKSGSGGGEKSLRPKRGVEI